MEFHTHPHRNSLKLLSGDGTPSIRKDIGSFRGHSHSYRMAQGRDRFRSRIHQHLCTQFFPISQRFCRSLNQYTVRLSFLTFFTLARQMFMPDSRKNVIQRLFSTFFQPAVNCCLNFTSCSSI